MEVRIREFRKEDIDGLYFLDQRCYAPAFRFRYHQLVSTLLAPEVTALVAEAEGWRNGGVMGALIVRGDPEAERLTVVALMIEPSFRRLGLGRRLLDWAARLARAQGFGALVVPVEAGNETAAGFLAACGLVDGNVQAPFFTEPGAGSVWTLAFPPDGRPDEEQE